MVMDRLSPTKESKDQALLQLYRHWNERRGDRPFPAPEDIDQTDFAYASERVSMIEVSYDPLRFRYWSVAPQLTAHLGYNMTGSYVDEVPEPSMRQFVRACYERVIQSRAPVYEMGTVLIRLDEWWHEVLVLPLSSDGSNIDMLLAYRSTVPPVAVKGHPIEARRAHAPPLATSKSNNDSR